MTYIQSGLLLIDKPEGPSSAHVVHRVKKILGAKRVGHLGTLDPFASGLLP
ncbi:MAG: tRNA pseudouridine(55) synthase TruB, partial [Candidatus Binatia bacterium]